MSLSVDLFSIVVQFASSSLDRLNILTLSKSVYEVTKDKPIWFHVTLKRVPCQEKLNRLMNIKFEGVKELPKEMNNVRYLDCSENKLESLPSIPKCEWLDCSSCDLMSLPKLTNCISLNCSRNELTELYHS